MTAQTQLIAGRFRIDDLVHDLLGQGGMGAVYRATDTQSGALVAIKALRPEVCDNPDLVRRFEREGEALRQLDHPNIVKMLAAVQADGQHYLVMEYVQGGSLQEQLDVHGPLPPPRLVEIALDLADAITRAHRLGIIHRDLKPGNVLLAQDGTPRLTDFGLAHIAGSRPLTEAGMLVGTLDYLSPEACRGEGLDESSDIWAFGVLLFTALTGRLPFAGETLAARLNAILTIPVPDLAELCPAVPDGLADLVYRMLEKDPLQRIGSVRLVGAELEALWKQYRTGSTPGVAPSSTLPRFISPPQTGAARHNLPAQPTPFVGREPELAELDRLIQAQPSRLVTILGLGGMGKTRLALEAGARQLERFSQGVYFVPLAPLRTAEALLPAVAQALGFSGREDKPLAQQLHDYLANKRLLLILDNFEHLLAAADLLPPLLQAAPQVQVLATTRERLNVQGEQLFHLGGMDFPDWETPADALEYSAVKLFMQSALRVRPDYDLAANDLKYIARICRLVQGLPLGILLAAAWVELLSPAEVAEELGRGLDFLTSETRDLPDRHRSLRAVFDYSWQTLTSAEQMLFQGLAVFQGGFDRPAAQQVCGAGLRELMTLNNKSLVYRNQAGRYEIHELLHQYAAEKLAAAPEQAQAVGQRHSAYYCALLQRLGEQANGPQRAAVRAVYAAESANARAAWHWAVAQRELGLLAQAAEGLTGLHISLTQLTEGQAAFCQAAEALACLETPEARRLSGSLLARQAYFSQRLGQVESASQLLARAQACLEAAAQAGLDTRSQRVFLLQQIAQVDRMTNAAHHRATLEECLALAEALGDHMNSVIARTALGWYFWGAGDLPAARQQLETALALAHRLGYQAHEGFVLSRLSYVYRALSQPDEAEALARRGCDLLRAVGDKMAYALGIETLAHGLLWAGKLAEACPLLDELWAIREDQGDRLDAANDMSWSALAHLYLGDEPGALERAETGLARVQQFDNPYTLAFGRLVLGQVLVGCGRLAEAEPLLQASLAALQQLAVPYDRVSVLNTLTLLALEQGQPERARGYLKTALETAIQASAFTLLALYILPGFCRLLLLQGQVERAVELYALSETMPLAPKSRWHAKLAGRHVAAAAAGLPPEVVAAAQARGQARRLPETAAEILVDLEG
jgi:serine/threonine protein kinase